MAAGLTLINLNVYPYGGTTVVDYAATQGTGSTQLANYALTGNNNAGYISAYPATGSGGTVGVFTPASATYVAGFLDGEQRCRLFYTDGTAIGLPSLKYIAQTLTSDAGQVGLSGTGTKGGGFKVVLTANSSNLIDATSPMTFYLDGFAMLITAGTQYG